MNRSILKIIVKILSSFLSIFTPYYFINKGLSEEYGLIILNIATFRLIFGWIISSNKKLITYAKKIDFLSIFNMNILFSLIIIVFYVAIFFIFKDNSLVLGLIAIPITLESILIGVLERNGDISLSILIKSSFLLISGFISYEISKITDLSIISIWVISYIFIIISTIILWKSSPIFNKENIEEGQLLRINYLKQIKTLNFINLSSSYWLGEIDILLSSEAPILICGLIFGPDITSKYSLLKTVIKLPCLIQGFTNPYTGFKLRRMIALNKPFKNIKKYFYRQTAINSLGAIAIFSSISLTFYIFNFVNPEIQNTSLTNIMNYQLSLILASLSYVIVAMMGPITNILLTLGKQKILGFITFTSSIIGISMQIIISRIYGFEGFLISSTFSAMMSNILSRILLERLSHI